MAEVVTLNVIYLHGCRNNDFIIFLPLGVWNDTSCSQDIGFHAMLLVGYGTTRRGEDYWLVKNSWGCGWGDNGYIKVARTGNNLCGIADYGIYPLV